MANTSTAKKLTGGILAIVVLALCLCMTTFALIWTGISMGDHSFHTGSVEINLNDGEPVITENEFLFEPGMTVEKEFFVQNNGPFPIYYKLYLENISGDLAPVLQVTVKDGEQVLYAGTADEFIRQNVNAFDDALQVNERKNLTIAFYFPKEKDNGLQHSDLSFILCADGVQTKNNPNRLFD